jgi:uncharacterized membrane protein YphA (DoxX/SURF4 family)
VNLNYAQIILATMGLIFMVYGISYSKKLHKKIRTSDSWVGFGGCILAVFPWYVTKVVYILSGIFLIIFFISTFV